jgi:hypothetical protein
VNDGFTSRYNVERLVWCYALLHAADRSPTGFPPQPQLAGRAS